MYKIIEIIIVIIIVATALTISVLYLRQEFKGKCSFGNACDSCKIRETCSLIKSSRKKNSEIKK